MSKIQSPAEIPNPADLSLEERAAQLVMIDIPDQSLGDRTREHLKKYPFNGVILFAKNVVDRAQVVHLNQQLNEASSVGPPLITVDQEGGIVDRFRFPEMNLSPGAMALGATEDPELTRKAHQIMGTELASLGIAVDFAPCLDVNSNPANPIIGVRSFGSDPVAVTAHGLAAVDGLQSRGVAACCKHFPGHGDTDRDSHLDLPTVARPRAELDKVELAPFKAAIEAGVEAIMTAHVTFPALDPTPGRPATLSPPILTGLLREEYGFEGVIFTDSMAMHAIAHRYGVGEAAVLSVEAGADIVLACGPFEHHVETVEALAQAMRDGRLSEERVLQSLHRIFELKKKRCRLPDFKVEYQLAEHAAAISEISQASTTVYKSSAADLLPLQGKTLILIPDLLPQTPLGEVSKAVSLREVMQEVAQCELPQIEEDRYHLHASGDSWRDLSQKASTYDRVVVCLYSRDRLPDGQRSLLENLVRDGVRPIVVSFSSPYLFESIPDGVDAALLTYNYTPASLMALARVLLGQVEARGRCPVQTASLAG